VHDALPPAARAVHLSVRAGKERGKPCRRCRKWGSAKLCGGRVEAPALFAVSAAQQMIDVSEAFLCLDVRSFLYKVGTEYSRDPVPSAE
jgi:hypothetical protein